MINQIEECSDRENLYEGIRFFLGYISRKLGLILNLNAHLPDQKDEELARIIPTMRDNLLKPQNINRIQLLINYIQSKKAEEVLGHDYEEDEGVEFLKLKNDIIYRLKFMNLYFHAMKSKNNKLQEICEQVFILFRSYEKILDESDEKKILLYKQGANLMSVAFNAHSLPIVREVFGKKPKPLPL